MRFRLAADKLAVRAARLRVRELDELPAQTAADAELVISELVVNALLHARLAPDDTIDLGLTCDGTHLVIEVDDHGSFCGRPRGRSGIGFRVLDALCDEWSAQAGHVRASLRLDRGLGAAPQRDGARSRGHITPPARPWQRHA